MAGAFLGPELRQWLLEHGTPSERSDVAALLEEFGLRGIDRRDADLITLDQARAIGSSLPLLTVNCYILPWRVSAAFRRDRLLWIGIVETHSGPARFVGRIDLLAAWASNPAVLGLVDAQDELLALARLMYP